MAIRRKKSAAGSLTMLVLAEAARGVDRDAIGASDRLRRTGTCWDRSAARHREGLRAAVQERGVMVSSAWSLVGITLRHRRRERQLVVLPFMTRVGI
jgi:hypothetical protein